jgi:hypothetical protein
MAPPPALPPTIRLEESDTEGVGGLTASGRRGGSRPVSIQFGSSLESEYCKALYDYGANGSDELSLHEDDIIHILSRCPNGVEDGWWLGELGGRTGLFPSIVVEECQAVFCGSEIAECFGWIRIRKKKFGLGFRHCCRMKIFVKNQKSNT